MRNLAGYISESFYKNTGSSTLSSLLDNVINKDRNTYPEDLYKSLNMLADYLVKKNLLKPIKLKGYRFNKYPGIYVNYINDNSTWNGRRKGGICFRILDGSLDPYHNETITKYTLEAAIIGAYTGGIAYASASIDVNHNSYWSLKGYINGICTEPSISHFYYISDEKVVEEIRNWLQKSKPVLGAGRVSDKQLADSIETIHALDNLQ